MVRKRSLLQRNAFTLIELVFAIVIIAISVLSLPMMVQTTSKGIANNIVQEAIFGAAAIVNESTAFYWDQNSTVDANISDGYSRVVNTGDCSVIIPDMLTQRPGHIHRQCLNDINIHPTYSYSGDDNTSIPIEYVAKEYNNTTMILGTTDAEAYKDDYNVSATVTPCMTGKSFIQFGQEANNPDMKEITVTVFNSEGSAIVVLRAYSTNIGEVKPESRIF